MMMVVMAILQGIVATLLACFSHSLSLSFRPNPLRGTTFILFQAHSRLFLGRYAVFLHPGGFGIVCRARWGLRFRKGGENLWIGTGLGLSVNIGGSLGNITAVQIVDIPAGQLKTDVS